MPYWLHKYDITDENKVITATFRIIRDADKVEVFNGNVSKDGTFVCLDPGTKYLVEEIQTPANYVGTVSREFTTPNGLINREQLKDWFADESTITHLKFYNKPYKTVNLKKIKYNSNGGNNSKVHISFEVYQKEGEHFKEVTLPDNSNKIVSNTDTKMAPGTYYFKEIIGSDIINPLFLMSIKADGTYDDYIIRNGEVYYGPVTVTAAENRSGSVF